MKGGLTSNDLDSCPDLDLDFDSRRHLTLHRRGCKTSSGRSFFPSESSHIHITHFCSGHLQERTTQWRSDQAAGQRSA